MSENRGREETRARRPAQPTTVIEVQVCQPERDCLVYAWNRERASIDVTGVYHAEDGLPADMAVLTLEGQMEIPAFLLTPLSLQPGTLVQAQVLGALRFSSARETDDAFPMDGWFLVTTARIDARASDTYSLAELLPGQLSRLQSYVEAQAQEQCKDHCEEWGAVISCDAETTTRLLRETRLLLKRERRVQSQGKGWLTTLQKEEKPVAWRAIEGLSEALRAELQQKNASDASAPHAQAEQLIRFVPQRFQQALTDLFLDDERLLAFIERPLLRHRAGILGMHTWRSNEGLLLITDRQVLWLRDFLSPGSGFLPGGYIAHSAPIERLKRIVLLPAGKAPFEFESRLEERTSPYLRLVIEVESRVGTELFVVEFPVQAEVEKALARVVSLLHAFLPSSEAKEDRRVRRVPMVDIWQPRGAEAERLAGLGGIVPVPVSRQLEQRLTDVLQSSQEELLVSTVVPALEDAATPARLVALTRHALLLVEDVNKKRRQGVGTQGNQAEDMQRYELSIISSAQLRYSIMGASLSFFVPQRDGRTQRHAVPFHSPAIAWFLPLFMRLRVLLSGSYQ